MTIIDFYVGSLYGQCRPSESRNWVLSNWILSTRNDLINSCIVCCPQKKRHNAIFNNVTARHTQEFNIQNAIVMKKQHSNKWVIHLATVLQPVTIYAHTTVRTPTRGSFSQSKLHKITDSPKPSFHHPLVTTIHPTSTIL